MAATATATTVTETETIQSFRHHHGAPVAITGSNFPPRGDGSTNARGVRVNGSCTSPSPKDCPVGARQHAASLPTKSHVGAGLPAGWPSTLRSAMVWDNETFDHEEAFTVTLQPGEVKEIEHALNHFVGLQLHAREIKPANFPLPKLHARLRSLSSELHHGRGFFVLRGLDPQMYDPTENMIIYLGVASHVAPQRRIQDPTGNVVVHIFNDRKMETPQADRGAKSSNRASSFHTDCACDILALQVIGLPAHGGRTMLASSWKLYNELAATAPEVVQTLSKPDWVRRDYGKHRPATKSALLYHHDGRIVLNFSREALLGLNPNGGQSHTSNLTPAQLSALSHLSRLAQKHSVSLPASQPGDMIFINNLSILHARESFEDNPPIFCRHLIRLWLRDVDPDADTASASRSTSGYNLAWQLPEPKEQLVPWYVPWYCRETTPAQTGAGGEDVTLDDVSQETIDQTHTVEEKYCGIKERWEIEPVSHQRYRSCWFAPH